MNVHTQVMILAARHLGGGREKQEVKRVHFSHSEFILLTLSKLTFSLPAKHNSCVSKRPKYVQCNYHFICKTQLAALNHCYSAKHCGCSRSRAEQRDSKCACESNFRSTSSERTYKGEEKKKKRKEGLIQTTCFHPICPLRLYCHESMSRGAKCSQWQQFDHSSL